MSENTERFTDRVADYVKFRPSYPVAVVEEIEKYVGKTPLSVADIGSGTGIFTRLLLERAHGVFAVEPNVQMRLAAEEKLKNEPGFHSVAAPAEATTLPDKSVDVVTVAQAFHWFDQQKAKAEFRRILRPKGAVALIWNEREVTSGFGAAYEEFLRQYWDYAKLANASAEMSDRMREFYGENYEVHRFPHVQELNWESFRGRFFSASYSPKAETVEAVRATVELKKLFETHHENNQINMVYETELYIGRV